MNEVTEDVLGIVSRIREMFPGKVRVLMNTDKYSLEAPYQLLEYCKDGQWREICKEYTLDQRVIDKLWNMFNYSEEKMEKFYQEEKKKQEEIKTEIKEEAKDLVSTGASVLGKGKLSFSFKDEQGNLKVIK